MNKKWFFMLTGIFLSAMLVGCNVDPDPAPPEVDQNQDDTNDLNGENDNVPGVDEDDNILKDDEEDADPDPEDPIEDPEDIVDEDRKDE